MALESGVIFLVDKLPNLIIWQVYPKIKVPKKAFVIVITLFLGVINRKVVESIVVDLANVFNSLVNCVLATL